MKSTQTVWIVLCFGLVGQAETVKNLRVTNIKPGTRAHVVFVNAEGVGCKTSRHIELPVDGQIAIENLFVPECGCNSAETRGHVGIAVLAEGRAAAYQDHQRLCAEADNLNIELAPRRPIRIDVWTPNTEMTTLAKDDLANFDWILDTGRTGIRIEAVYHAPNAAVHGNFCTTAPPKEIYTSGVLNLYYGVGDSNQHCIGTNLVQVHDSPVPGDAAHEVGHALGLQDTDTSPLTYETGHTTGIGRFRCDNIMWNASDVLKAVIAPAQAFWMAFSCNSSVNSNKPCLLCSSVRGSSSPCPVFELALETPKECPACSVAQAESLRVASGRADLRVVSRGRHQLCTLEDLLDSLDARFAVLVAHVKNNPGLMRGSLDKNEFRRNWGSRIGVVLTAEATAKAPKDSKEREAGLAALVELKKDQQWAKNQYLVYAIETIKAGEYKPRCGMKSVN